MPVYRDGDFYIERPNPRRLWLRKDAAWSDEGRLITTGVFGLFAEGRWSGAERFKMALSPDRLHFYPDFSTEKSEVHLNFTPSAPMTVYFVDNLAAFLQNGSHLICTAFWDAGPSNIAALTFEDMEVPPFASVYCVMPDVPDNTGAGLQATLSGELV